MGLQPGALAKPHTDKEGPAETSEWYLPEDVSQSLNSHVYHQCPAYEALITVFTYVHHLCHMPGAGHAGPERTLTDLVHEPLDTGLTQACKHVAASIACKPALSGSGAWAVIAGYPCTACTARYPARIQCPLIKTDHPCALNTEMSLRRPRRPAGGINLPLA